MIQTYQGYFQEDGRFVVDGLLTALPIGRRAIVNILEDEIAVDKKKSFLEQREQALVQLFAEAEKAESALSDEEWAELENLHSQTNMARTVDL